MVGLALIATSMIQAATPKQAEWTVTADAFPKDWVASGRMIWGDVNNDGLKDVFCVAGQGGGNAYLYKNNGNGTFTRVQETVFTLLSFASAEFIDYDNDGDLDLVTVGNLNDNGGKNVTVYENKGSTEGYAFVKNDERSAELVGVGSGSGDAVGRMIQAVDFDHDGWTDLVICGERNNESPEGGWRMTRVFKNNQGSFAIQTGNVENGYNGNFIEMVGGSVHVGDVNNDGYADIFAVGYYDVSDTGGGWGGYLYVNDGDGTFTKSSQAFSGSQNCETIFVDINGDGYSDILEVAEGWNNLYINNKDDFFTKHEMEATGLNKGKGASITAGDINNDGLIDLFISGMGDLNSAKIFYNNGDLTFTAAEISESSRGRSGSVNLVDINNDDNLDYSCFGYGNGWINAYAINALGNSITTNTAPTAPTNFVVNYADGKYSMTWNKATDAETAQNALRYNIFAYNQDNGAVYTYAPANLATGRLKIGGGIVPLIAKNSFELAIPEGNYVFGVQTVDQANLGSKFTLNTDVSKYPAWTTIKKEGEGLPMTSGGSVVWGDYNNDGYLDVFFNTGTGDHVGLYKNNGDETFTLDQTGIDAAENAAQPRVFQPMVRGYSVFVDYNNDGYLDIVTTGRKNNSDGDPVTIFYRNTGSANGYLFEKDEDNSNAVLGIESGDGDRVGHMLNAVDIDNDGWVDLVLSGNVKSAGIHPFGVGATRFTAIYKNVQGKFELQKNNVNGGNFEQMGAGAVHVGDFNNDGFADIVNVGKPAGSIGAAIYKNNGDGTFTMLDYSNQLNTNSKCDIVFADMNGDGYDDIVEITKDVANIHISKGDGTFEKLESATTGLLPSEATNITIADVNNDGYLDIFTSGYSIPNFTAIYYNNGDNTFTVQQVQPGARPGTANFVDMNNDGNLDAAYYGWGDTNGWPTRFLRNDLGVLVNANTAPVQPANVKVVYENGKLKLSWDKAFDAETAQSALRYNVFVKNNDTGATYAYAPADLSTGRLKIGGGIVPLIAKNSFEITIPEDNFVVGVQTVDQSNVASQFSTTEYQSEKIKKATWTILKQEGEGSLPLTSGGSVIWGDYNNDGKIDAFVNTGENQVHLYQNNGDGTFTTVQEGTFQGMVRGYSVFTDYDNDGNLDLIITGRKNNKDGDPATIVYRNAGNANGYIYEKDSENSSIVLGLESGDNDRVGRMLNAVDVDNDGWVDLILSGNIKSGDPHPFGASGTRFTAVYKNVNGKFELQSNNVDGGNFVQLGAGAIHVGDLNNDGFADIVNVGKTASASDAAVYKNNGDGTFTKLAYSSELNANSKCDIVFADINGDGYDDMVEITKDVANLHISKGDGTFEKSGSDASGLLAREAANITVGDINNDGFIDLFMSTYEPDNDGNKFTKIYYNNGDNTFSIDYIIPGSRPGTANLVDMTNDGNLDASYYGLNNDTWPNRFLRNDLGTGIASNTAPSVPTNFKVEFAANKFTLTWDKSTDAETAQDALRYNIYIKNKVTGAVYAYAPADIATGKLRIGGNIVPLIGKNSIVLNMQLIGEYTFGVQAIDQADVASAFVTADYENKETGTSLTESNAVAVYSANKAIVIDNKLSTTISYTVLTPSGQAVATGVCPAGAKQTVSGLAQGIYIVKTTGKTAKVLVF